MNTVPLTLMGPPRREWPDAGLDIASLRAGGHQPTPFSEFVIKVHSRCNLACDYCYMYEMADQSWRDQPKTMSRNDFDHVCGIIAEHARHFGVPGIRLIFHGGEPLLAGPENLEYYARHAHETVGSVASLRLGMQTNGILLADEVLSVCDRWGIRVAVSIDGDRDGHDRHRKNRRGTGSYDEVAAGMERLTRPEYRHLFSGLLCTIDVDNDPVACYESLIGFRPPAIDFLLPHGNWTTPPPRKGAGTSGTPYADWLIAAFDRWYRAPTAETQVRLFDDIIELLLGGSSYSEAVGLATIAIAVFETDGTVEQVDELKSAFAGATKLRLDAQVNPLDAALWEPAIVARQIGVDALGPQCRDCPVHRVCGGGHYVHRYRAGTGFRNPSVYCADLLKLIDHIASAVRSDLDG